MSFTRRLNNLDTELARAGISAVTHADTLLTYYDAYLCLMANKTPLGDRPGPLGRAARHFLAHPSEGTARAFLEAIRYPRRIQARPIEELLNA